MKLRKIQQSIKVMFVGIFFPLFLSLPFYVHAGESLKIHSGLFGLWAWGDMNEALQMVKNNGFDIFVGSPQKDELDKAYKLGLKSVVALGLTKEIADNETRWMKYMEDLKGKITGLKDHPAVFAWYVVDEPDWQNIPTDKIRIICDAIRAIDKKKPLGTVLSKSDKWGDYLSYFDIIAIDPYLKKRPDGTHEQPQKVGEWIRKIRSDLKKAGLSKPVWVVLGAFDLKNRSFNGQKANYHRPTPEEFNEMVRNALREQVEGILVFTLAKKGDPVYEDLRLPDDDPALWAAVRRMPYLVGNNRP